MTIDPLQEQIAQLDHAIAQLTRQREALKVQWEQERGTAAQQRDPFTVVLPPQPSPPQPHTFTVADVGKYVRYAGARGKTERGRIKDVGRQFVFVVFQCDGQWERYQEYPGQAMLPRELLLEEAPHAPEP